MQHGGGRRNRVRAEENLQIGQLSPGDETPGERLSAGDRAIETMRHLGGGNGIKMADATDFRRFAIDMPGIQRGNIGIGDFRALGELPA